ncbi:MAG: hypothetical protein K0S67_2384 [Nitrososphaeraceae archaeon]|nr:hypothetical protein [Nitrososphaeraceae archaeon]
MMELELTLPVNSNNLQNKKEIHVHNDGTRTDFTCQQ